MPDETAKIEMPEYVCNKKVHALKIAEVIRVDPGDTGPLGDRSGLIVPEDTRYSDISFDTYFSDDHNPHIGDYYVVYKDGRKSISSAEEFEAAFTLVEAENADNEPFNAHDLVKSAIIDRAKLTAEYTKILAFTKTENFRALDASDKSSFLNQLETISMQSRILCERIIRFDSINGYPLTPDA